MASAPAPLRIENGGLCSGVPTLASKVAPPVLLIVMLPVAVVSGAASKCKVCGDTAM
jgi:hypothetical protein